MFSHKQHFTRMFSINPDPLGVSHEQDRAFIASLFTLSDRLCCVIKDDKGTKLPPIVHWSVATRIHYIHDYRPKSLKGKPHRIIYQDGELVDCTGVRDHIELPQQNLRALEVGDNHIVTVYASEKCNRTGLYLIKDKEYLFEELNNAHWNDGGIDCGAEGWTRKNVTLGVKEIPISVAEPFRRVPDANWFKLCGAIGCSEQELFEIGKKSNIVLRDQANFVRLPTIWSVFMATTVVKSRSRLQGYLDKNESK